MKLKQRLIFTSVIVLIGFVVLILRLQSLLPDSTRKEDLIDTKTSLEPSTTSQTTSGTHNISRDQGKLAGYKEKENLTIATKVSLSFEDSWNQWMKWVTPNNLYPEDVFWSSEMTDLVENLGKAPVTLFGLGHKGTQLKATMHLVGGQKSVFKPMRYERDEVVSGGPFAGFDRHNGEITGFHLDGLLEFRLAPPVVGRKINLTALRPVTDEKLFSTYLQEDGNTCFYGKCYYCKPAERACAKGAIMEGSVTIWLPDWYKLKTYRHPYQRTYRDGVLAKWEKDEKYCTKSLLVPSSEYYPILMDVIDSSVFDFLMGNADRHHYETYAPHGNNGRLLHIDNGKSFGNPFHDEMSVLAPIKQCCRIRNSTWKILNHLHATGPLSKILDSSLHRDPLYPILSPDHLLAIDRRHNTILNVIRECFKLFGERIVLVTSWAEPKS